MEPALDAASRPAVANKWLVAVTAMMATTMEVLDTSIANVALQHIRGSLSAGVDEVTWVLTSYLVANAIILPLTGFLGRRLGRTRFFTWSIAIFTASSVLCGFAPDLQTLIAFRIVQGLAGGALVPTSQAILVETFPPEERGMAMAVWGIGVMFGPIAGPTLGGWITDNYSWRWIFYINLPIGILAVLLATAVLRDPPGAPGLRARIDALGVAFLVVWVGALQVVLDKGQQEDWFSSRFIVWLSVAFVAGFVAFVARELTVREPVVDLRIFKNRSFTVGTSLMALMGFGLYGSITMLPLYAQAILGYTAWLAGLVLAPGGVGTLLVMPIAGRLVNRVDSRLLVATGGLLAAASMLEASRLTGEISMGQILLPRFIQGLGFGFLFVPLSTATLSAVAPSQTGNASGVFNLLRNIGGSVGIAVATTLLARGGQAHQVYLAEHVNPYNPQAMAAQDAAAAAAGSAGRGLALLYQTVLRQAQLLAFLDVFRLFAVTFLLMVPLVVLMRGSKGGGGAALH